MTEIQQQEIFETWLSLHRALLFKVVRVYASREMDRDDLFQEISIQIWKSIPSFRQESSVLTWMYRIALNTAIKWTRKEKKFPNPHTLDEAEHILHSPATTQDDRLDWLYAAISTLDSIDRSLTLLMLDNFSYREMSTILGITESNVGVKINRIKKHLISKSKKYQPHGI